MEQERLLESEQLMMLLWQERSVLQVWHLDVAL